MNACNYARLLSRLVTLGAGELFYMGGNLLPRCLAIHVWSWALRCNRHHTGAALNRALTLLDGDPDQAWEAFLSLVRGMKNPWNTSASDLYLTWIPGRMMRRFAAQFLWGPAAREGLRDVHDQVNRMACVQLAAAHFHRAIRGGDVTRASVVLRAWGSLVRESPEIRWARVALAWASEARDEAAEQAHSLIEGGRFLSPLDTLRWAQRFMETHQKELAEQALGWARRWIPEEPDVWRLLGESAWLDKDSQRAKYSWERALSLNPEDINVFILWLMAKRGWSQPPTVDQHSRLIVELPPEIPVGGCSEVYCRLEGEGQDWELFVLPPAGWGIVPRVGKTTFDSDCKGTVILYAARPDRIRGRPWPVTFVAVRPGSYVITKCAVRVADAVPGRLMVTVTEDHEIHEERGALPPDMLHKLLVEKSRFASSIDIPWTHMVDVGSVLSMPGWAAEKGNKIWKRLEASIRDHMVEDLLQGNDIQPHLHAFNDPQSAHFPYSITDAGWHPSLKFLLTSPEARGDWASACPPPNRAASGPNRSQTAERAVARVEAIGRLGDPDYRAVLWRSGLLDFGEAANDRAWSMVALRRAGLLAVSDLPKSRSPFDWSTWPAFLVDWERPFDSSPGGPLLQMPILANLEGDYLMGPWLLRRRARKMTQNLREKDGRFKPGVHLFTLLTHDKFINARHGRDEFRLDPHYGDWITVREHVKAWQDAGAEFVTAREGVKAVVSDLTWRLVPWMEEETFISLPDRAQEVRYTLKLLGRGITVSQAFPQHILVTIPPSLRPLLTSLCVFQGNERIPVEWEKQLGAFWLVLTSADQPIRCTFRLKKAIGPMLQDLRCDANDILHLTLESPAPFLRARILLPWESGLHQLPRITWSARDEQGRELVCQPDPQGLILYPVQFRVDGDCHVRPLHIQMQSAINPEEQSNAEVQMPDEREVPKPKIKVKGKCQSTNAN